LWAWTGDEGICQSSINQKLASSALRLRCSRSCAFSVNDLLAVLLVLLCADPGGGKGAEGGERGGTLPDGVLSVGSGDNTDFGAWGSEGGELSLETVGDTLVHSGATRHDDVLEEITTDIDVGGLGGFPREGLDGLARLAVEVWLEDELGDLHSDGTLNLNLASVWESVGLVEL
jgi:hypothetical protein